MAENTQEVVKAENSASTQKVVEEDKHLYFGNRRSFLSKIAWGSFFGYFGLFVFGSVRGLFNRAIYEPSKSFKAGFPSEYTPGTVDERFKSTQKVWIIRTKDGFIAQSTVCTHLGCTPRWLPAENKFKCPCHGSGFYGIMADPKETAVNFEGPAPRPLERFKITLDSDGQISINKAVAFLGEKGQWDQPGAFLPYKA